MKPFLIGIAGGTGSGKSTLALGLRKAYPDQVTTVHLDDYYYPPEYVPKFKEMLNYEDPESLDIERLVFDLTALKRGEAVVIHAKDHTVKAEYGKASPREYKDFEPRRFVVVEGFLTLWPSALRALFDLKVYLEAPFELHLGRRIHFMMDGYAETVLKPMHDKYVAGSKQYADIVLDVADLSAEEVLRKTEAMLPH